MSKDLEELEEWPTQLSGVNVLQPEGRTKLGCQSVPGMKRKTVDGPLHQDKGRGRQRI